MKHLPGVAILRIFVRNMRSSGKSDAEILAVMTQRLNLERFDVALLDEEDKARYAELKEFLRGLEEGCGRG